MDSQLIELDIGEPDSNVFESDLPLATLASTPPHSLQVKLIITDSLPHGLISIEELTSNEEEESPHTSVSTSDQEDTPEFTFSSFQPGPWYFTPLNFLDQGLPRYTTPYSIVLGFDMSRITFGEMSSDTYMFFTSP